MQGSSGDKADKPSVSQSARGAAAGRDGSKHGDVKSDLGRRQTGRGDWTRGGKEWGKSRSRGSDSRYKCSVCTFTQHAQQGPTHPLRPRCCSGLQACYPASLAWPPRCRLRRCRPRAACACRRQPRAPSAALACCRWRQEQAGGRTNRWGNKDYSSDSKNAATQPHATASQLLPTDPRSSCLQFCKHPHATMLQANSTPATVLTTDDQPQRTKHRT